MGKLLVGHEESRKFIKKWYDVNWLYKTSLVNVGQTQWHFLTKEQATNVLRRSLSFPWTMSVTVESSEKEMKVYHPDWSREDWWHTEEKFRKEMEEQFADRKEMEQAIVESCEGISPFTNLKVTVRELIKEKSLAREKLKVEKILAEGAQGLYLARQYVEDKPVLKKWFNRRYGTANESISASLPT